MSMAKKDTLAVKVTLLTHTVDAAARNDIDYSETHKLLEHFRAMRDAKRTTKCRRDRWPAKQ